MAGNDKKKVAIVGATGYTGIELTRLLKGHSKVEIATVTSDSEKGRRMSEVFGTFGMENDPVFVERDTELLKEADVVFFATPNGVAMQKAPALVDKGIKVVDLSADFRIRDVAAWEKWYGMKHEHPDYIEKAVYGLCEMNKDKIKTATLIANPGCYPTCVGLALLPLLEKNLIKEETVVADCKSGVSGAGRKARVSHLFCEVADSMSAYGVAGHRHLPEIRQTISNFNGNVAKKFIFTPHLIPMIRGMMATIYFQSSEPIEKLREVMEAKYTDNPLVEVTKPGVYPDTASVRASNRARIAIEKAPDMDDTYILVSVIDNLVKGAAGQAIQNMNLMMGWDEYESIDIPATWP